MMDQHNLSSSFSKKALVVSLLLCLSDGGAGAASSSSSSSSQEHARTMLRSRGLAAGCQGLGCPTSDIGGEALVCQSDSDCDKDCFEDPSCFRPNAVCNSNHCVNTECQIDSDCIVVPHLSPSSGTMTQIHQVCIDYKCIEPECDTDEDCNEDLPTPATNKMGGEGEGLVGGVVDYSNVLTPETRMCLNHQCMIEPHPEVLQEEPVEPTQDQIMDLRAGVEGRDGSPRINDNAAGGDEDPYAFDGAATTGRKPRSDGSASSNSNLRAIIFCGDSVCPSSHFCCDAACGKCVAIGGTCMLAPCGDPQH